MEFLLPLAAKSLLVAGATLLLLKAIARRSAADRSLVAHIGLAAILALPLAAIALPQLTIETGLIPAKTVVQPVSAVALPTATEAAPSAATFQAAPAPAIFSGIDWLFWAYVLPAGLLLLFTLIALTRLVLLQAKANVLIEPHWLTALARAQRRMGFKHGTALLTSDELSSPISWGLMRPVILLNDDAANARSEAEAIIAHELAHVAHLDWLKLLLSRVTVAVFWFNPLVWLLAREAHQLREEAADDAVLASDIEDTEYAKLLVGIARHECRGLLIGAHGVAPARGSLARRVARVLDTRSVRGPVARSFALGVFVGAAALAAPLAAVTLSAADASSKDKLSDKIASRTSAHTTGIVPNVVQSVLPNAISTAIAAATGTIDEELQRDLEKDLESSDDFFTRGPNGATVTSRNGITVMRSPSGATVTVYPADAHGRQKIVAVAPNGATTTTYKDARAELKAAKTKQKSAIERAIEMKAVGVTPEYAASIRPYLRDLDDDTLVELRAVGVTAPYIQDLANAGFRNLSSDELVEARAVGVTGGYIRSMAAAGYGGTLDEYVEMRAVGVTPEYVDRFRRRGIAIRDRDQLIEMRASGLEPDDVPGGSSSSPPAPPDTDAE